VARTRRPAPFWPENGSTIRIWPPRAGAAPQTAAKIAAMISMGSRQADA
jgi:hypothetical protein